MSGGQLLCKVSLASVGDPKFGGVKDHLPKEGVAARSGRARLFSSRTLEALNETVPLNSHGVADVERVKTSHQSAFEPWAIGNGNGAGERFANLAPQVGTEPTLLSNRLRKNADFRKISQLSPLAVSVSC